MLAPSNAGEQQERQGEEAQDEAGMKVGPDQEDDRKPRARPRAASRTSAQPRSAYSCGRMSRNGAATARPKVAATQLVRRSPARRTRSRKRISHATTITSHFQYARLSSPNARAQR